MLCAKELRGIIGVANEDGVGLCDGDGVFYNDGCGNGCCVATCGRWAALTKVFGKSQEIDKIDIAIEVEVSGECGDTTCERNNGAADIEGVVVGAEVCH